MLRKSQEIATHIKSQMNISPYDISVLKVRIFSLRNKIKIDVTV